MSLPPYQWNSDLAHATTIPATWYTEPEMLKREQRQVFGSTWQAVGHTAALADPGSYLACDVAGEPIVVTRAKDGVLRAFSNVCRHRGAVIAEGAGQASVLRCPYHAWTYSLD